jgi:hypothetical protein
VETTIAIVEAYARWMWSSLMITSNPKNKLR